MGVWDGRLWNIDSIETVHEMGFMLFRLILVDEWPMDDMMEVSKGMTYVLVGSYMGLVAILFINLYIALLSDTFQRIYDNAQQNAAMQRARFVMEVWTHMNPNELRECLDYFNGAKCSPWTEHWDDDDATDDQNAVKKMTHQIYEKIEHLDQYIREEE